MARTSANTIESDEAKDPSIGDRKRKQPSTRASQRAATKSRYFEHNTDESGEEAPEDSSSSVDVESEDDSDDEPEEHSSEEKQRPRKRRTPASTKTSQTAPAAGTRGKELWRQGVSTGLAPGTQVIIKKPKPRAAGSTPYSDDTIHPNTMLFLKDLKANNDLEWLKSKQIPSFFHSCVYLAPCQNQRSRQGPNSAISPHHRLDLNDHQIVACALSHHGCAAQYSIMQQNTRQNSLGRKVLFWLTARNAGSLCSSSICAVACSQINERTLIFICSPQVLHPLERLFTPLDLTHHSPKMASPKYFLHSCSG